MKNIKLILIFFIIFFHPLALLKAIEITPFFKNFSGLCVNSIHDLELIKNFSKLWYYQDYLLIINLFF